MGETSSPVLERFRRLARHPSDARQGGLVKMPMWIGAPGDVPARPWGAVWVSRQTEMVNMKLAEGPPGEDLALEVADPALGEAIARSLGDSELEVRVVDDIPVTADVGRPY